LPRRPQTVEHQEPSRTHRAMRGCRYRTPPRPPPASPHRNPAAAAPPRAGPGTETRAAAVLVAPRCGVQDPSEAAHLARRPSQTSRPHRPRRPRTPPPSSHRLSPLVATPALDLPTSRNHSPPRWDAQRPVSPRMPLIAQEQKGGSAGRTRSRHQPSLSAGSCTNVSRWGVGATSSGTTDISWRRCV
jgi:hypothetical protein